MSIATGVSLQREGDLALIRLEGAARLNPIGTATCAALAGAIGELESDGRTRAVVVHGAGRAFSAGADIDELNGFADASQFEAFIHTFTDTLDLIEASAL